MLDVVAAILENNKGEILVARRKQGKHLAGYWEFPGGKVEEGESPEQCLIRELQEEMNITIDVIDFVGENIHRYSGQDTIRLLAFKGRIVDGEIRLVDHDSFMWVDSQDLKKLKLAPADIPFIPILT